MTANYFDYHKLTESLFYGVPLTENHLNNATEKLRLYIVNGGAGEMVKALGIGIEIKTKSNDILKINEIISRRFIFTDGAQKGKYLTISEIENIGHFFKYGAYYKETSGA